MYSNFGTPRNTLVTKMFSQSETEKRFVSFYSNVAYTYNSKYTLNAVFEWISQIYTEVILVSSLNPFGLLVWLGT